MNKYIYPCLGAGDLGFIKMSGPGLANMMLVAARAYCLHRKYQIPMLSPTWRKLSIGPYLRHERDKRNYFRLFENYGTTGLRKFWLLNHVTHEENRLEEFLAASSSAVLRVAGLGRYFCDLDQTLTHQYFWTIANRWIRDRVMQSDYCDTVAMHVRLGDYDAKQRTALEWYARVGGAIYDVNKDAEILVFSDGTDQELSSLLKLPNVRRAVRGNALEDMLAISRCRLVVASDSTFSAMGAFIGSRPVLFPRCHFYPMYSDPDNECIATDSETIREFIKDKMSPLRKAKPL